MNPRFAATITLQAPHDPEDRAMNDALQARLERIHRPPTSLTGRDVCCHCKQPTVAHRFITPDGQPIETHHCRIHGNVIPMRSHIANPE